MEANQSEDADVTMRNGVDLDVAVNRLTAGAPYVTSKRDGVWAVISTMGEFDEVLGMAVANRDVLVHKADRDDGRVTVVLKEFEGEI